MYTSPEKVLYPAYFIDSAPSLGVYYFLSLTLSVCVWICHALEIASSFLFIDGIESFFDR